MLHGFFIVAGLTAAPSALSASPARYDGAAVRASGVAERVSYGRGSHPYAVYDLCDASGSCVRVVRFGAGAVAEGSVQAAIGTFRRLTFAGGRHVQNAVVIGHP